MATDVQQVTAPQATPQTPTSAPIEREFTVKSRSQTQQALRRFMHNKLAMAALVVYVVLLLISFIYPHFYGWTFDEQDASALSVRPGTNGHPFGTDEIGRDLLARMMMGIQRSTYISVIFVLVAGTIGVLVGAHRRLLRQVGRQRADALRRHHPDRADPRRDHRRGRQLPGRPLPDRHRAVHRAPRLDGPGPDRAQLVPLAARAGVRRGGARAGRLRQADHPQAPDPQLARPDHRLGHARRGHRGHHRGGAELPRLRRPGLADLAGLRWSRSAPRRRRPGPGCSTSPASPS